MTPDTIEITLMWIAQVKELETTNDDRRDADISNTDIDALTMKYYTMTTAKDEDRIFTMESPAIMNKIEIRLEVEEVRSLKAEPSAMIIIDKDDNGSILDTVKYTRTSNDDPLEILNTKYSRTLWSQDQHRTL